MPDRGVSADLETALSGNKEEAVFQELARSEDRILGRFDEVLARDLPAPVRTSVEARYREVARSRRRIKVLGR